MQKIESMIFFSYFIVWLITAAAFLITSKFVKDVKKKTKMYYFFGSFNTIAFVIVANIMLYLWKAPILARLIFNLLAVVVAILSFMNIKYCQHCGVMNQWVMFRKYCSKCGGLIESQKEGRHE